MGEINREVLKSSSRLRRKRLGDILSYFGLFFAFFFALSNFVFHLDRLYIRQVYIEGNRQVEDSRIFDVVKNALIGKYYGIYPRSNVFIYPKDQIIQTLLHSIPKLASASVVGSINSLLVKVEEREPKFLWCDDVSKPIFDRVCFYLDKDGFAFDKAPSFSSHVYFEFYGGNKRGGYMGHSILPVDIMQAIVKVRDVAATLITKKDYNLGNIYGVNINKGDDYDLLIGRGAGDWKMNFNLAATTSASDILRIEKKLHAVLSSQFFITEQSSANKKLQYIDLRFGKKVFYKFE